MNKNGHIALGVAAGTVAACYLPEPLIGNNQWMWQAIIVAAAAIGGLAPDLDHKTSTASGLIQFSASKRRALRFIAAFSLMVWAFLAFIVPHGSAPIWLGAGILLLVLERLRGLVLIGAGALMLHAYYLYQLHWIAAFAGFSFLLLPLVKHRGAIHSPEFAAALSIGLWSFGKQQEAMLFSAAIGFTVGWWAHLAGDIFGSDGVRSLLIPRLRLALRWFSNGSGTERWIARWCWGISLVLLGGQLFVIFN